MSLLPEAKLAREAEMAFQVICMATDYDCWRAGPGAEDVDVSMVMRAMETNGRNARRLVAAVLDELCKHENGDLVTAKHWEGASKGAVMFCTKPEGRSPEALRKARYLFPGFLED